MNQIMMETGGKMNIEKDLDFMKKIMRKLNIGGQCIRVQSTSNSEINFTVTFGDTAQIYSHSENRRLYCFKRAISSITLNAVSDDWVGVFLTDNGDFICSENCVCQGSVCQRVSYTNQIQAKSNQIYSRKAPATKTSCTGLCTLTFVKGKNHDLIFIFALQPSIY